MSITAMSKQIPLSQDEREAAATLDRRVIGSPGSSRL